MKQRNSVDAVIDAAHSKFSFPATRRYMTEPHRLAHLEVANQAIRLMKLIAGNGNWVKDEQSGDR